MCVAATRKVVLAICALLSCTAADMHSRLLYLDAERLMTHPDALTLFSPQDRTELRSLLGRDGESDEIDRLLAARAVIEVTISPEAAEEGTRGGSASDVRNSDL